MKILYARYLLLGALLLLAGCNYQHITSPAQYAELQKEGRATPEVAALSDAPQTPVPSADASAPVIDLMQPAMRVATEITAAAAQNGNASLLAGAQGLLLLPAAVASNDPVDALLLMRHGHDWSDPVFVRVSPPVAADGALVLFTRAFQAAVNGGAPVSLAALGPGQYLATGAGGAAPVGDMVVDAALNGAAYRGLSPARILADKGGRFPPADHLRALLIGAVDRANAN